MRWTESITLDDYATTLQEIKIHLRSARVRAVLAADPLATIALTDDEFHE